jgi:hypothetical protein
MVWRSPKRHLPCAALLAAAAAVFGAPDARADGDVDKGRAVAERVCKRCHVIGPENLHGSIGSTPSFFIMSDKLDDYRGRLLSVTERPPHNGQDIELTLADRVNLTAYIATLERP